MDFDVTDCTQWILNDVKARFDVIRGGYDIDVVHVGNYKTIIGQGRLDSIESWLERHAE